MFKLILSTIGLSATDCLDPLAISVQIYLLTTRNPILNSLAFLFGIALVTFLCGLVLAFGVIREVDTLLAHPQGLYFSFQLIIGVLLCVAGYKYLKHTSSNEKIEPPIKVEINPGVALFIGITFTATDLPTNVPLIAVAEALVKNNADPITVALSCLAYSLVRILPPATILAAFMIKKEASTAIIERIQGPMIKWGHKVTAVIIILLGITLSLDSLFFYATGDALLVI